MRGGELHAAPAAGAVERRRVQHRDGRAQEPVRLLLSGPSGGSAACALLSQVLGEANIVGVDMGGTSFDVSVVRDGRVNLVTQGEIDRMPVRLPMVEIRTIGAGGGSIATVRAGGRLTVGPESAGSRPGPACYGRGGTEPTVTDANIALGRLDGEGFLGGGMRARRRQARATAIETHVAQPLGLASRRPPKGCWRSPMPISARPSGCRCSRRVSTRATSCMIAFGGAAGLHAIAVAEELRHPARGVPGERQHAVGIRHPALRSWRTTWCARRCSRPQPDNARDARRRWPTSLLEEAQARLDADAVPAGDRRIELAADMRYKGQAFELTVPAPARTLDDRRARRLIAGFHAMHRQRFSYANPGAPVEIVSLRVSAIGRLPKPEGKAPPAARRAASLAASARCGWAARWREIAGVAPRPDRAAIRSLTGPAVIEEAYTTVLIADGWTCRRDAQRPPDRREDLQSMTTAADISPIELEIIHNALTAAAAEMDVTVWRTSRSTIVRELLDYSTAIFDRDGWNVAQAARIPSHLNSMSYFLARDPRRRHIPADQWEPDDIVISNDPYCGGQHLPDIVAFKAVFQRRPAHRLRRHAVPSPRRRRLLARQLRLERHRDLPGGPAHPAGQAVRGGQADRADPRLILQNVRQPELLWGDLQSQIASLQHRRGEHRAAGAQARRGALRARARSSCSTPRRPACGP